MKNKKAQFYFFAIVLIAVIFIGLITISNFTNIQKFSSLSNYQLQIENERSSLLDYLSSRDFSESESNDKFETFSTSYISQLGEDKTVIFLYGTKPNGKIISNVLDDTVVLIDGVPIFSSPQTFTSSGTTNLTVDQNNYFFEFQEGQNIYYLVQLKKNNEVYIIYG